MFYSDLVKLILYAKMTVRIEARYEHYELPGICEYFNGNSVNSLCFNVNSGSAHVTHTLVFFSQLSLSESIPMSVFALSSDAHSGTL